jgi:acyl dehydratase
MTAITLRSIDEYKALVGQRIGPTDWRTVGQADVDAFARLSGDRQWIHVDEERAAKESPYKGTIAHGNLTLAMIDGFRDDLLHSTAHRLGVNYGWNKVRFPAPVPTGSRLRAFAEVLSIDSVGDGWWQVLTRFTVEVSGNEKPACVGESVVRFLV